MGGATLAGYARAAADGATALVKIDGDGQMDPTLVGRTIQLNGKPFTVIGVLAADSPFERNWAQIWLPLAFAMATRNSGLSYALE